MDKHELEKILEAHKLWLEGKGVERANLRASGLQWAELQEANLQWANLREADLYGADLQRADLQRADLQRADLQGADLQRADLQRADLQRAYLLGADLRGADLRWADLQGADLREADLRKADLDYSVWPLWCGGLHVKTDRRIMAQLAYHFCCQECDDPDYIKARDAILWFANSFHLVDECGELEPKGESMISDGQITAAYLGCCNARGWKPTVDGLEAFRRDILRGTRDERGVILWPSSTSQEAAQPSSC